MKVILLQKIHNLGSLGDIVNVKPGYARNYLVPYGKAISATEKNIKEFELRRHELEVAANDALAVANERVKKFEGFVLKITARSLDEGKLFGSVGVREIVDAFIANGIEVKKREINLPSGPIHSTGEYEIDVRLHGDVAIMVKVIIEQEK